ncbi:MAG: XRE family transcriptional regulator [Lawsonibacter sp.]|nr:XRE family transcriptional regulator [Lawsonibacter sp.]
MAQFTAFGKEVKKALIDVGETQDWLMKRVGENTGLFVDSGYMYKILTGQRSAPKIVQAIGEILDLPEQNQDSA